MGVDLGAALETHSGHVDVDQDPVSLADGRFDFLVKEVPLLEESLQQPLDCGPALELVAVGKLGALAPYRIAVEGKEGALHVAFVECRVRSADRLDIRLRHLRND